MSVGDKVLIVHDASRSVDVGQIVWICGRLFHIRLIPESELGTKYKTLHVNN